ncbi:FAD-dependent monooxygenase [Variovorax ginsengisoli]|uniref:FAD-dependent monooxygenase n=1 Tax=Variovorax ginsengisoli TaxID=363844 RepID=A0ABT8S3X1_9BURK|nr:FAD-dependent monooxygenase [Variovorax ginsengisoli]MDN8614449.1 FAD-dependent monooxygenase [Variovorax ginsengisoli]MDO1533619.1 FAD-dependent monooxygenase [Variovorax ginsengisoli]
MGRKRQPPTVEASHKSRHGHTDALGVRSGDRIYLDAEDEVIHRAWMPQTQTSRNILYGAMRRALPASCVHAGERLVSFKQSGERVTVLFASGRMERGDLLICADGAGSTVRSQLLPGTSPAYAGSVA